MNCVLALLLFVYSVVQGTNLVTYQVAPNSNATGCFSNANCVSFSSFLQDTEILLADNSTVEFYPSVFTAETTGLWNGIYNLILSGYQNLLFQTTVSTEKARFKCSNKFKLSWLILFSRNVHIKNIEMIECGVEMNISEITLMRISTKLRPFFNILLAHSYTILVENVHITIKEGSAITSVDTAQSLCIVSSKINGSMDILYSSTFSQNLVTNITMENSIVVLEQKYQSMSGYFQHYNSEVKFFIYNLTIFGSQCLYSLDIDIKHCTLLTTEIVASTFLQGGLLVRSKSKICVYPNAVHIKDSRFTSMCSKCNQPPLTGPGAAPCGINIGMKVFFSMVNSDVLLSESGLQLLGSQGLISNTTFKNNKNALHCRLNSTIKFQGNISFIENVQDPVGFSAIHFQDSVAYFEGLSFIYNNTGGKFGAAIAQNSTLYFGYASQTYFEHNQGFYGGAITMFLHSILNIASRSASLIFNNNHAWKNGGAVYIDKFTYNHPHITLIKKYQCFFYQFDKQAKSLTFSNNTSVDGGDAIYGSSTAGCYARKSTHDPQSVTFLTTYSEHVLFSISNLGISTQPNLISSDPERMCFCNSSHTMCDNVERNISIVPGETIQLSIVAVGQVEGTTLATAYSRLIIPYEQQLESVYPYLSQLEARQLLQRSCTQVRYTIHTPLQEQTLVIATKDISNEDVTLNLEAFRKYVAVYGVWIPLPLQEKEIPLYVHVKPKPCPLGYTFNQNTLECECLHSIIAANLQCNINNQSVLRSGTVWVNATNNTIIVHKYCPLGYCNHHKIELSLTYPDKQCSYKRSGTLCGECRGNLSQLLGSSDCKECSNTWVLLVIPLTIINGFLLVVFLIITDITVTTGTVNGLIIYANIVRASNTIYFSEITSPITSICNVFIAWINLDVGIEMCFYHGLNGFFKTLFQLAFPVYICTLAAGIIISSHYSTRAAKLSGNNAVKVLATLFLLSYSKSIRFLITVLSFTTLTINDYKNGISASKNVWLYDGNIYYLHDKHIALFLIAIFMLVFVSFPYTAILILIPWLQTKSHYRWLTWVWKMKPPFDAYTGPYKKKHRYWTGLLLLLRVLLYAIFSLNISGDPSINLLATAILMVLTLSYTLLVGSIYKSKALSILELSFLLNLTILSICSLFAVITGQNQELITDLSVIVTIGIFGGVFVYHTCKRFMSLKAIKKCVKKYKTKHKVNNENEEEVSKKKQTTITSHTISISDLEDPLL